MGAWTENFVNKKDKYHTVLIVHGVLFVVIVGGYGKIEGGQAIIGNVQQTARKLSVLCVDGIIQIPRFPGKLVLTHGVKQALFKKGIAVHDALPENIGPARQRIAVGLSAVYKGGISLISRLNIFIDPPNVVGNIGDSRGLDMFFFWKAVV